MDKCDICNGQNINLSAAVLASFLSANLTKTELEIITIFLLSLAQSLSTIINVDEICSENKTNTDTSFLIQQV